MFCVFKHDNRACEDMKFLSFHHDFASASQAMQNAQAKEFYKLDKLTSGKTVGCGGEKSANISYDTDDGLVSITYYVVEVPGGCLEKNELSVEEMFPSWNTTPPGKWSKEAIFLRYGTGDKEYLEISLFHEPAPKENGIEPFTLHIFDGDNVIACHGVPHLTAAKRYVCPLCRNEEHLPGARFCMICGTPIEG